MTTGFESFESHKKFRTGINECLQQNRTTGKDQYFSGFLKPQRPQKARPAKLRDICPTDVCSNTQDAINFLQQEAMVLHLRTLLPNLFAHGYHNEHSVQF